MAEKKATCDVQVFMEARIAYKSDCDNNIVKITFSMTDVPVDANDEMIKLSASSNIADDIDKGTGIIRAVDTEDNCVCFIAISDIRKFTIKSIELKRGE
jgi:hypothetical protein